MNRIQELREKRGLRREDVAARAGISYDYVRKLEAEGGLPGLAIARRVADALGVTVDEAFPDPAPADPVVDPLTDPSGVR